MRTTLGGIAAVLALSGAAALGAGAVGAGRAGPFPPSLGGSAPGAAAAVVAAPTAEPTSAAYAPAYRWPTTAPPPVVRAFDGPGVPWARGHRGVDLALAAGEPVLAPADGLVAFAGTVVDRPLVSLTHADGIRTTFEPVVPAVVAGVVVHQGDVIGYLAGSADASPPHCLPASCLHWGARRGPDGYLDPLLLLRPRVVVRLYPTL